MKATKERLDTVIDKLGSIPMNTEYRKKGQKGQYVDLSLPNDTVDFRTQKPVYVDKSILNLAKTLVAAMAIGLATQSCSDDDTIKEIVDNNTEQQQVLDFSQAMDKLRSRSDYMTTKEVLVALDSTVHANTDKIDKFAKRSNKNYEDTSNFVNTVLSALAKGVSGEEPYNEQWSTIVEKNDGLLNGEYVEKITSLYQNIDRIKVERPDYFDSNGYLADIYSKKIDLRDNCDAAEVVRHNAIQRLKQDVIIFDQELTPTLSGEEYNNAYNKIINQLDELYARKTMNSKEAEEKVNEMLQTYNELNKIARANGKHEIYESGVKMLNASHVMVDAASRVLIKAMEAAVDVETPKFSESFELIHNNLNRIINSNKFDTPVVNSIINGLDL